jgi:hypothetical protein
VALKDPELPRSRKRLVPWWWLTAVWDPAVAHKTLVTAEINKLKPVIEQAASSQTDRPSIAQSRPAQALAAFFFHARPDQPGWKLQPGTVTASFRLHRDPVANFQATSLCACPKLIATT